LTDFTEKKKQKNKNKTTPFIKTEAAQNGNVFLHSVRTQDLLTSVNYKSISANVKQGQD